jgi:hypothetical protein
LQISNPTRVRHFGPLLPNLDTNPAEDPCTSYHTNAALRGRATNVESIFFDPYARIQGDGEDSDLESGCCKQG